MIIILLHRELSILVMKLSPKNGLRDENLLSGITKGSSIKNNYCTPIAGTRAKDFLSHAP